MVRGLRGASLAGMGLGISAPDLGNAADPHLATASVREGCCLLCKTSGHPIVWEEDGYQARQCPCGVLYVDPEPPIGEVDPRRDLHTEGYYRWPAPHRLAFLQRFASTGTLLEVGFGRGDFLSLARDAGFDVAGVDPNPFACVSAERRGFRVECATMETSGLPEAAFDVVFHVDLLSHVADPIGFLDAMRRRLRPGGTLVFEVGAVGGLHPRWHWWSERLGLPEHRQFFSEKALRGLLARAHLRIVGLERFSLVLATTLLRGRRAWVEPLLAGPVGRMIRWRRPYDDNGLAPRTCGLQVGYERIMELTRYRAGAHLPRWGPLTLFVAARAWNAPPSS